MDKRTRQTFDALQEQIKHLHSVFDLVDDTSAPMAERMEARRNLERQLFAGTLDMGIFAMVTRIRLARRRAAE